MWEELPTEVACVGGVREGRNRKPGWAGGFGGGYFHD